MRILYVVPYIGYSGVISGTIDDLEKRGHEIFVIGDLTGVNSDLSVSNSKIRFYDTRTINISLPGLVNRFPVFLSFQKVIDQIKPDIIHVNCLPFLTTYQATKLAQKNNIPCVVHVHGVSADRGFLLNLFQSIFLRTLGILIFRDSCMMICLTENDAQQIKRLGCAARKICIIQNGVDIQKFSPESARIETDGLILWLGRFVPEKGLFYLIEAFNRLIRLKGDSSYRLLLVGDGPSKSNIKKLIKKSKLESVVDVVSAVPHEEVVHYLNKASIFVLPSLKEGMPYVLLESMACMKAVVGSDISGINSVITNRIDGVLVPPKNPEALSDALIQLLEDKELRHKLGVSARQLIVSNYNLSIVGKKIETMYYQCLTNQSAN